MSCWSSEPLSAQFSYEAQVAAQRRNGEGDCERVSERVRRTVERLNDAHRDRWAARGGSRARS